MFVEEFNPQAIFRNLGWYYNTTTYVFILRASGTHTHITVQHHDIV
jgi:hypothetical protein